MSPARPPEAPQDGSPPNLRAPDSSDDLSALAWVHDELRRSLEAAHKSLRRFVREVEAVGVSDLDAVDPAVLRSARAQIHQGVGALELVGLPAAAAVLRASEALLQKIIAKPHRLNASVVELVEQSSFGLLDYLGRLLAGRQVSPLSLFPQYRAVLEAAGAERVHPADLWSLDWAWHAVPSGQDVAPLPTDAATRGALEGLLLTLMKTPDPALPAARMSDICAGLALGAADRPQTATFWNLAAAVFEAQAQGLLAVDVFGKRVASRLLAQFRTLERGEGEVSERLAQDLLFFCAQSESPGDGRRAPRLAAVRQVYGLAHHQPADYHASPLGRFDPALILQARKRVAAAKEAWSAVAGGEMHRLTGLSEQFALVGESLKRLFPHGEVFAAELQQAVAQTQQAAAAPPAPLAMEVATSLLYIEAVLEDGNFDHPEQADRVRRLADRLHGVRQGRSPDPLEGWMEELYRRVSDRQTMGSVVQELRASLSEIEASIDRFFRDPARHEVLLPVPHQLSAMRGVLSVLGMDHAATALLRMRDEVDGMISTEIEPEHVAQAGVFDRLAGNLGALGFLIDMLSVQPQTAKTLFRYDAGAGVLSPVMGREAQPAAAGLAPVPVEQRLIEQAQSLAFNSVRADIPLEDVSRDIDRLSEEATAADQPTLASTVRTAREAIDKAGDDASGVAAARAELSEALVDFVHTASEPVALAEPAAAVPSQRLGLDFGSGGTGSGGSSAAPVAAAAVDSGLGDDPEMRDVFLEEAREVLDTATAAHAGLRSAPDDLSLLTTLRRAFHTLKGSSRMVGLKDFGEAAWTCEQLYNTHLAEQKPAGAPLLDFTAESLAVLGEWVKAIAAGRPVGHDAASFRLAADRVGGVGVGVGVGVVASSPLPIGLPPDLPSAADLDLASQPVAVGQGLEFLAAPFEAGGGNIGVPAEPPTFELDLSAFDLPLDLPLAAPQDPVSVPAPAAANASADADAELSWTFEPFETIEPAPAPGDLLADAGDDNAGGWVAPDAEAGEPILLSFDTEASAEAEAEAEAEEKIPAVSEELQLDFDLPEVIESAPGSFESEATPAPTSTQTTRDAHAAPLPAAVDPVALLPAIETTEALPPLSLAGIDTAEPSLGSPEPASSGVDGQALAEPSTAEGPVASPVEAEDLPESVKVVGPLRIGIPLFNIYLNEADELSRRLCTEVAEWSMELHRPIGEMPIALAHSLAGSSATVGFADLSHLARSLEHAQARSQAIGHGTVEEGRLFVDAADEIRRLLHQFAAGFLREPAPELLLRLADHERSSALRLDEATAAAERPLLAGQDSRNGSLLPLEAGSETETGVGIGIGIGIETGTGTEPGTGTGNRAGTGVEADADTEGDALADAKTDAGAATAGDTHPHVGTETESHADGGAEGEAHSNAMARPVPVPVQEPIPVPVSEPVPWATSELAREPAVDGTFAPPWSGEPAASLPLARSSVESTHPVDPPPSAEPPAGFAPTDFRPFGEAPAEPSRPTPPFARERSAADAGIDAVDAIDAELFPIFEEEAEELLPQLASRLRDWSNRPSDAGHPSACMRTLHTLKGGARLAGAMRLGEMAHQLESRIERLLAQPSIATADVERLQHHGDALSHSFDALRRGDLQAQRDAEFDFAETRAPAAVAGMPSAAALAAARPAGATTAELLADVAQPSDHDADATARGDAATDTDTDPDTPARRQTAGHDHGTVFESDDAPDSLVARIAAATRDLAAIEAFALPPAESVERPLAAMAAANQPSPIDWSRFASGADAEPRGPEPVPSSQSSVRVRAPVLDRLVNQAGEVSITRSRIEAGVARIKLSLADLTENLDRLRSQLRDIEFHGEVQMTSRMEAAKAAAESFDPLEFDRFTRFQELTRMMAESVNDVATVQRTVQRALETTEDDLVAQSRLTRDLQDDLLRTRMVEFEGLSDRLYRVVRQAAKETGKSVRLDIVGGGVEVDRGVLDRMTGAFEHLLRNSVTHGIEAPAVRTAAGKEPTGSVVVALSHEGNEVGVEIRDDGAGLNLERIRARGLALGLVEPTATPSDAELANLIFLPGFTTAEGVTELAGRGVGMDVVRSEVDAMGGRIETATSPGRGTSFKLVLPLTTAVTQVVMLRCGELRVAVPSTLVDAVQRLTADTVEQAHVSGSLRVGDASLPFYWLGALLQTSPRPAANPAKTRMVVVVRSAQQRIALHVDEVVGNQEVVVKNLGPQLSRMPGLAGVTLLASGSVALIYNPVALGTLYGETAQAATQAALRAATADPTNDGAPSATTPAAAEAALLPLVMVVDDSLTVRRVTQRLLIREGYRVVLAKDGLDALERLTEEVPQIVLSDIEMPRMDGFDLVRNMRADARLRDLPVVMITSRIAQKHRDHAAELGVDHYLGKPYAEEDLLSLVSRYTRHAVAA